MTVAAVIVGFDGSVIQSLDARTMAVCTALGDEGIDCKIERIQPHVAGRSFFEIVQAVVRDTKWQRERAPDLLALELAALRADRLYAAAVARGLPMVPGIASFIQQAASRSRVVLRADSRRRDVTVLLEMCDLEQHVAFVHCADDEALRADHKRDPTSRTLEAAYDHIARRLSLHGIATTACLVHECGDLAREMAMKAGFGLADVR